MSKYRKRLPQFGNALFITDGGLEHALSFEDGLRVPAFLTFDLLRHAVGRASLGRYFARYAELARSHGVGLVLESPTARANPDWGANLGYGTPALAHTNRKAIELLLEVRSTFESSDTQIVISGNVGPRADAYDSAQRMDAYEAAHYHAPQIETLAQTEADMVSACSIGYADEAIGIALVAAAYSMPLAVSFRLRSDGRLSSGEVLAEAIGRVDRESRHSRMYYMIECASPAQFAGVLAAQGAAAERIRGLRLIARNGSDIVDAADLGTQFRTLRLELPHLSVAGASYAGVHAMCAAMSAQPVPVDAELPLSQLYSTEFHIGGVQGGSGAKLKRTSRLAARGSSILSAG